MIGWLVAREVRKERRRIAGKLRSTLLIAVRIGESGHAFRVEAMGLVMANQIGALVDELEAGSSVASIENTAKGSGE